MKLLDELAGNCPLPTARGRMVLGRDMDGIREARAERAANQRVELMNKAKELAAANWKRCDIAAELDVSVSYVSKLLKS